MGTSGTPLQYRIVDRLGAFIEPDSYFDNNVYHSTILLRFIWSVCSGN